MSYVFDKDLMHKTFSMGETHEGFKHRPAQRIKIFPFPTNNNFTIVTSLSAVIGEWLRLVRATNTVCDSLDVVLQKISNLIDADTEEKDAALHIIRTLFWDDDNHIRPNGVDSMCYIPCDDSSELKIAHYLCSVLGDHSELKQVTNSSVCKAASQANSIERVVLNALKSGAEQPKTLDRYFTVHTAPQKTFLTDLRFVLDNSTRTREYLVDLLEFYYFFYTAQTSLALSRFEHGKRDEIVPLFFSLDWEKTNKARECYSSGWQLLQPALEQQFYHAITLELLNQIVSDEQFDYIKMKEYIDINDNEDEVAEQVRNISELYRSAILHISSPQACAELQALVKNDQLGIAFSEVHYLFDSVRSQFQNTERGRVSDGYIKHFKTFCHDKYLKNRRSNGLMLNITEEFLIFLTKLAIKHEEQMSLNEVFHQFELRGVFLDQPSKDEVVKFYTKLNLIDKKSDSGDAQYVKRIL